MLNDVCFGVGQPRTRMPPASAGARQQGITPSLHACSFVLQSMSLRLAHLPNAIFSFYI